MTVQNPTRERPQAPPPAVGAPYNGTGSTQLVDHTLHGFEVFAQSLAAAGPSVALALTPSLVFLTAAGHVTWSFVVATVLVLLVAANVVPFARRRAAAGSVYTWTAAGLGRPPAFACGWGIVIGYVGVAAANLGGVALFGSAIVSQAGGNGGLMAVRLPILLVASALVLMLILRGVQISSRVGLALEVLSLTALTILFVAILIHHGLGFDSGQFDLSNGGVGDVFRGAVLATGAFVGFESAGSLGAEARNPYRTIPRVLIGIVVAMGAIFVVGSYIEVLGFGSSAELAASAAPLNALAGYAGIPDLAYALDVGLVFACLACAAALLNAAGRSIYSLGREGVLPTAFGRAHREYKTPHVALSAMWGIAAIPPLIFIFTGTELLTGMAYAGTVATFGFLVAYLLVSVANPAYNARIGELKIYHLLTGGLATAGILYVIWKNLSPAPPSPYNVLPYVFLGLWALGILWYGALSVANPDRARRLGTLHDEVGESG